MLVSGEYADDDPHANPCNSAVMVARKGADILSAALEQAHWILLNGEKTWGAIGPHLVSGLYENWPSLVERAPYRALNGWNYYTINDYYANPRDPGENVRVIHLYSSDHPEWLEDRWMP